MKQLNASQLFGFFYGSSVFLGIMLCSSLSQAADKINAEAESNEQVATAAVSKPLHEHSSIKPDADVIPVQPKEKALASVPEQSEQTEALSEPLDLPENKIVISNRPQVTGLWGMTIPGARCIEYYNFMENGEVVVKSGEEWSYGNYLYQVPALAESGSPVLAIQIKYDNLETDCSGNAVDQRGEQQQQYVKWTSASSMEFCGTKEGTQCFASLRRVLP
ncbi:hypothetical protein ACF3NA_05460 [Alkanindiges sp. WGS2144]|uniref:hypothetical protein n=1 Tax=Alkanindiges sp. WGS2144 TaxID=3366808 RepID=UPI0037516EEA